MDQENTQTEAPVTEAPVTPEPSAPVAPEAAPVAAGEGETNNA